jgi:transposase-like protein
MYSKLDLQKFAEAYAMGRTYDQIAQSMGVNRATLVRWRKELGLPRRKPGVRAGTKRERRAE